jgi:DNA-directed RNA polymerase specialized sigma24 family protein
MNWPEMSDQELVELCLRGEEDAWVEFLRRFQRLVAGVAAKTIRPWFVPNPGLLEDLWHDSLQKILANECRILRELEWRHEGSLRGVLRSTASSVALDYVRKQRAPMRDVGLEEQLDEKVHDRPAVKNSASTTENRILMQELARCLEEHMDSEPEHKRDIAMYLLYHACNITAADLARLYQLGLKGVENAVARIGRIARKNCLE